MGTLQCKVTQTKQICVINFQPIKTWPGDHLEVLLSTVMLRRCKSEHGGGGIPFPDHPQDSDMGPSDHTRDSDNNSTSQHHSNITNYRYIDLLGGDSDSESS